MRDTNGPVRRGTALLAVLFCLEICPEGWGQSRPLLEYDGDMWPVVAMDGTYPIIDLGNERRRVYEGRVALADAPGYTDGGIEILAKDASMGPDYGSNYGAYFFRFYADLRADRDFEHCFVLFAITPEQGDATYVMRQIPDIAADGPQRILITIPVNPGFGGGQFFYLIFSQGEEIKLTDRDAPAEIRRSRDGAEEEASTSGDLSAERAARSGGGYPARMPITSTPAKVIDAVMPNFPSSLQGVAQGGYAEAVYSIGQDGRVVEILEMRSDRIEFVPEMVRAITESRYQPGTHEGKPLVTTVRQRFFFNEFASFPEAMEMVPYPAIEDRPPQPVYAPLPKQSPAAAGIVRVEILVDTLGRPQDLRIVSAPSDELADATLESAAKWLFLPAIKDSYPVAQLVQVPVNFKPKQSEP